MPFPDDLSDILPLLPGTGVTKRFPVFGHVVFVEIKMLQDGKYRLVVYDQYEGQTTKRFGAEGLVAEEEVESKWREFLDERESTFRHDRANHSLQ
jgi:hypothetical protein